MRGLMMDFQLTLPAILRRTEALAGHKEIVTRLPDKSLHRYTYAECIRRVRKLAVALRSMGIAPGDRIATAGWNHHQHLEAYFGIPLARGVLHTLNFRLSADDLAYIAGDADDRIIIADAALLPVITPLLSRLKGARLIVVGSQGHLPDGALDYENLLASADETDFEDIDCNEQDAAAMCYTSGTTGRPKGVLYSHRALVLHSIGLCLTDTLGVGESDVILPVVPMFHVNAWCLPFAAAMVGAKLVLPGPHLDPSSLADLFQSERVTFTAGVPTIWRGLLQFLDDNPNAYDLSAMRAVVVGGSAAPLAMIEGFEQRHGLHVVHAWGMTETTPMGTVAVLPSDLKTAGKAEQYACRAKQGRPAPLVEIRARGTAGLVPWDGQTMGELEVRGAWVARAYYGDENVSDDRFTSDGWFRTGDIVTIDARGFIDIQDRAKDLVKSGGEWISSVTLENALMEHPAVAEAAVIAVPHPRWDERPLAVVVLRPGQAVTGEELRTFIEPRFAKWWLPDAFEFVQEIPRTSVGKFKKSALKEQFKDYAL